MRKLLLGNEAIALGAWEAGVTAAVAYPGTPSTEILENIAKHYGADMHAQWSPNEKVALEVAAGVSIGGARALCCMKHVGLNVAADPLFTLSYTGVNGGLVIVVADDPGMHSSQNEQDSRFYARSAHLPMLEPADSAECRAFTKLAFDISERFDTPVLLRITTRVAHARSMVDVPDAGGRAEAELKPYVKDPAKYVMMPANARGRHVAVERRMERLERYASGREGAYEIINESAKRGVITSGIAYQYTREALDDVAVLKLNMVYPLPEDAIRAFAAGVDELVIIEELEPFIEDAVKAMGIECSGKDRTGKQGELSARRVAALFGGAVEPGPAETQGIPTRPPVLCPGCPHRAVFHIIKKLGLICMSDIGCYTLGALPPLSGVDAVICMGASIGAALGMEKARGSEYARGVVAVIGDSTFLHSGITPLMDVVYNGGATTVIILDNATTGMTGHQDHPGTGKNARGGPAPQVSLEAICRAVGVNRVVTVDPFDLKALERIIKEETAAPEPSVIVARRPCALLGKASAPKNIDGCRNCGACMRIGCPALERGEEGVRVNAALCNGCGLCAQLCAFGSIT